MEQFHSRTAELARLQGRSLTKAETLLIKEEYNEWREAEFKRLQSEVLALREALGLVAEHDRRRMYESCPDCWHKCTPKTGCKTMKYSQVGQDALEALTATQATADRVRREIQAEAIETEADLMANTEQEGPIARDYVSQLAAVMRKRAQKLRGGGE